jgi:hypothetical protein
MKTDEKCEICGKAATHFLFATFVCDCDECIQKAREQRGGPGGHRKAAMFDWRRANK